MNGYRNHLLLLTLCAFAAFSLTGCGLANQLLGGGSQDCTTYSSEYKNSLAAQGRLLPSIPTTGAYSMAMVLSQDAVNQFFQEVSKFDKSVSLGFINLDLKTPQLMVGMSLDEMRQYPTGSWLSPEPDELRAQRFYVKVGLGGSVPLKGKVSGDLFFSVPVTSKVIGTEKTEVWAELTKAELVNAQVSLGGSSYSTNALVSKIVNTLKDLLLNKYFEDYKLFELKSWQIGQNNVKLIAGGAPDIDPVNHTVTFGMFTNLIQSSLYSVSWSGAFPSNADVGLHIHPELVRKMVARMMTEGEIPDKVELSEQASSTQTSSQTSASSSATAESTFGVTIQELDQNLYQQSDNFNLGFRLWRVGGGLCGYADILAGLKMSIDQNKFNFAVDPDSLRSVNSSGSGVLAALSLNTLTQTEFFRQALSVANTTINFNEIELTESKNNRNGKPAMDATSYQLKVDGNGISVYLKLK